MQARTRKDDESKIHEKNAFYEQLYFASPSDEVKNILGGFGAKLEAIHDFKLNGIIVRSRVVSSISDSGMILGSWS